MLESGYGSAGVVSGLPVEAQQIFKATNLALFFAVPTGVLWVDSKHYFYIVQPFVHTINKDNRI